VAEKLAIELAAKKAAEDKSKREEEIRRELAEASIRRQVEAREKKQNVDFNKIMAEEEKLSAKQKQSQAAQEAKLKQN